MKTITLLCAGALLFTSCKYFPDFLKPRKKDMDTPSLIGSFELLSYKGVDPSGRVHYPYDKEVKGFAVFDENENYVFLLYDANRPALSNSDPFFCSNSEIRIAFLSERSSFGSYEVEGDSVLFKIEAAHLPNLEGKTEKRYFEMHSDTLLIIAPGRRLNGVFIREQSIWIKSAQKELPAGSK